MEQLRVRHRDVPSTGVRCGPVTAVATRVALGRVVAWRPWRRRCVDAGAREHVARLLGRRAEQQRPQAVERRPLLLDQVRQIAQGVNRRLERRVLVLGQRRVPRPVHQPLEILHTQIDPWKRRRHLSPRPPPSARPTASPATVPQIGGPYKRPIAATADARYPVRTGRHTGAASRAAGSPAMINRCS
jgi:hypothetical protein